MKRLIVLVSLMLVCFVDCTPTFYVGGVPNLVQVGPGLYRSGQATTLSEWKYLRSLGITRDIKLDYEDEGSDDGARTVGMTVYTLSIAPRGVEDMFQAPDQSKVDQAESIIRMGGGVLVHCKNGWDRTGYIIGRKRVLDDKWPPDEAYKEMLARGFHPELRGLREAWEAFAKAHQ